MAGMRVTVVPVTPFAQNCTLIWDEATREAVVIDPGGDVEKIQAAIAQDALEVRAIWLTHGHLDHAGAVNELRAALNSQMEIIGPDERDAPLLAGLAEQGRMFGLRNIQNVTPDRWLKEGDQVTVGPHVFDVLHCPGHTPGHVVFVNHTLKFAQLGDVLFQNSVGRTDFPYGDHEALIHAIRTKLMVLPDEYRFICGHGPRSTIGAERRSNPFIQ